MSRWDLTDDELLLDRLRDVIDATDPVPASAIETALAAFDMFGVDDELATLVADSLYREAVLVRHEAPAERLLTFTAPSLTLEIGLPADVPSIFGAVLPPAAAEVEIETASGSTTTMSDDLGRFHSDVAAGRCRLRVRVAGSTVVTPWIIR